MYVKKATTQMISGNRYNQGKKKIKLCRQEDDFRHLVNYIYRRPLLAQHRDTVDQIDNRFLFSLLFSYIPSP